MVLPLLRLHDVRGERKALWRDSNTVPKAERELKLIEDEQIYANKCRIKKRGRWEDNGCFEYRVFVERQVPCANP